MVSKNHFQSAAADMECLLNVKPCYAVSSHLKKILDVHRRERAAVIRAMTLELLHLIGSVLGIGSKEQMRRVYAQPIISTRAVVTDVLSLGNRAVRNLPRNAGSSHRNVTMSKASVSAATERPRPKPTVVWFPLVDLRPESLFKRQRSEFERALAAMGRALVLHFAASGARGSRIVGHVDLLTSRAMPGPVCAGARPLRACLNSTKIPATTPFLKKRSHDMNFDGNPINALIWLVVFLVVIFVLLRILGIVL